MIPRHDQNDRFQPKAQPESDRAGTSGAEHRPKPLPGRLNLLLSYSGWQPASAIEQLPRLLQPMGVFSIVVRSGDEATDVLKQHPIHIAVVDLGMPLQRRRDDSAAPASPSASAGGGARILQLLRRLDQPPPTVVIRPAQPSARENQRTLHEALREGAFAVLDAPLKMETMLETMRRVLRRHYANNWPSN